MVTSFNDNTWNYWRKAKIIGFQTRRGKSFIVINKVSTVKHQFAGQPEQIPCRNYRTLRENKKNKVLLCSFSLEIAESEKERNQLKNNKESELRKIEAELNEKLQEEK